MGYMTESREVHDLTREFPWQEWDLDGRFSDGTLYTSGPNFPFPFLQPGNQVTTSFRTGRRSLPDVEEQFYTNYADNFAKYKAEYSRDSHSKYDSGHTFQTDLTNFGFSHPSQVIKGHPGFSGWRDYHYMGPLSIKPNGFPSVGPEFNYTGSVVDGTSAINHSIPTASKAGLSTAVAEVIREGIPALIGAATLKARALVAKESGGEYLNYQFGWKPLVSDIQKACHAVLNTGKVLRQFERDSGRMVRRGFTFPIETETVVDDTHFGDVYFPGGCSSTLYAHSFSASQALPLIETRTTERQRWFKGAYTYYVPPSNKRLDIPQAEAFANHLLGLRITPEVLWNLAPWSWLSDWFINIGDVLSNANHFAEDSLVIRYGYLMCKTSVRESRTLRGASTYASGNLGDLTYYSERIRKERIRASPYGFGLTTSGFSVRQWAILAALGMTKSPESLRTN